VKAAQVDKCGAEVKSDEQSKAVGSTSGIYTSTVSTASTYYYPHARDHVNYFDVQHFRSFSTLKKFPSHDMVLYYT
jgi:hypothetical protein